MTNYWHIFTFLISTYVLRSGRERDVLASELAGVFTINLGALGDSQFLASFVTKRFVSDF